MTSNVEILVTIVLVAPILLAQSILLFRDAKKKGAYSWFWGIWGLIHFPLPAIFYYFIVIRPFRKKTKLS
jgi:hypothetical protein